MVGGTCHSIYIGRFASIAFACTFPALQEIAAQIRLAYVKLKGLLASDS
jgi:hypothetical protein